MSVAAELVGVDAVGQAQLVRDREVTPRELVEAALERLDALDPAVGAVVTRLDERALAAAHTVDLTSPLAGVPFVRKDIAAEEAGVPFFEGSRWLRDYIPRVDQEIVVRHRQAGLVTVATTKAPEFGLQPTTEPLLHGPTRNPWDLTRTASGSSGGTAAAVAARIVPLGHGNDLAGSLRSPAACCNLFALVPTRGRTPSGPKYGDIVSGWGVENGMSVSVRDSAALLDATCGPAPGDPYAAPPRSRPYTEEVGAGPGRLRIAIGAAAPGGAYYHPEVGASLRAMADLLTALGHDVVEGSPPGVGDEAWQLNTAAVLAASACWVIASWQRELGSGPEPDDLEPFTRALWQVGQQVPAASYLLAIEGLQRVGRSVATWHQEHDLWLCPSQGEPVRPLGSFAGTPDNPLAGLFSSAWPAPPGNVSNVIGAPAMTVPTGWSSEATPLGAHFLAPFGREDLLFRLASQLEQARPWADTLPPVTRQWLDRGGVHA